jgi:hypothetical protein
MTLSSWRRDADTRVLDRNELDGMGSDGTEGLLEMREAGPETNRVVFPIGRKRMEVPAWS